MSIKSNEVVSRYYSASELNNVADNDISTTPPSTNTNSLVRYVTCESDWNNFDDNNEENINSLNPEIQNNSNINSLDNINNINNNINDTRWSGSDPSLQERTSSAINNKREGGIFVTTVVEVSNSVEESQIDDNFFHPNNQQSNDQITQTLEIKHNNPRSTHDMNNSRSDKRHVALIDNNINNIQKKNLQQRKNSQKVKKHNSVKKVKRSSQNSIIQNDKFSSSRLQKSPSVKRIIQLRRSTQVSKRGRRQLEYAHTSNPISNNDPTDMEADLPPIKDQGFPWLPGSIGPPRLIHAPLIPLPRKNPSSNIRHTRDSSIQIDKTSKLFFNTRNPFSSLMSSNPTKDSQVNEDQELPTQEDKQVNRASQIFRRKLLEQSLAMSFGELVTNNNSLQNQQRSLIRKKTRKGSNARLEDREARRERRRKEREEKKVENESSNKDGKTLNDNDDKMKGKEENTRVNKSVVMSQIIDSDELEKIVGDEIKKRETLIYPQPPLRRKTNESIIPPDLNMTQKSSVMSQPPLLRRKTNENVIPLNSSISTEQPPFPTHLSALRKSSLTEGNKLQVGSPSIYSANSMIITPSEELENTLKPMIDNNEEIKNDDDYEIVPENRPTSPTMSRYRLGMGLFGLFNKREQSNQSTNSSSTSNLPPPKSPKPPTNLSKSPKSPTNFSFLPRSPKSPVKSTSSFSSFLPRYSRPSSPNPSTSPPSSSRSSQLSNPTNLQTSKSSRVTSTSSSNTKISRSSATNNNVLSPKTSKSRPAPLISRPLTPNLQFSPHSPISPKTFSLPASPVSPKYLSRPLSPLKSPINPSKLLRPGYTRHQTAPSVNPSTPSTTSTIADNEKIRKMQKLEAIIAETEANNKNVPKNTRPNKIRAFKSAKKTTTTATSPPSAIPIPATINSDKRNITTASSSDTTLTNTINYNDGEEVKTRKMSSQSEIIIRNSANSDTIHFSPEENTGQNLVSEDVVIRVTLTPAVCR